MSKKKISFIIICIFCFITKINAYTYSLNSSSSNVTVGSSVSVTLRTEDVMGFYNITSSNGSILAGGDGGSIDSPDPYSKTFVFTAKSVGTTTIVVSPTGGGLNVFSTEEPLYQRSVTITVVAKNTPPSINVNPTYSSNNYLKNLTVEGYDLTPNFEKNTLEYNITLNPGTEKINIGAVAEDSDANVKGIGELEVSEGINTFDIVVVAENGNERIYKLIVTVEEKDPIKVKVNGGDYTVVKKKELLGIKDGYEDTTVKINNFDIPALYNKITGVTLVGLKDKDGNIVLYSYDTKTGEYREYKEFKFDLMNLYIHENKNSKYKKITIKLQDKEIIAYDLEGIEDYYLLYATNTMTGYEGYYLYDVKENSVQRYDVTLLDKLTKQKDKYLAVVLVLSSVCFLTMLFLLIEINRDSKLKNENCNLSSN